MSKAPNKLNRDADGNIVLRVAHFFPRKMSLWLTVYGFVGIKAKRMTVLKRIENHDPTTPKQEIETILNNMALLWAMENDVSNFVVQRGGQLPRQLYHPLELLEKQS